MEETKSTAGQGLGIAGLILGILALLIAFIPCVGLFAIIPGIIAIVLSIVALNQAKKGNGSKGIIVAAMVISIVGTLIAILWVLIFGTFYNHGSYWKKAIDSALGKQAVINMNSNNKGLGSDMDKAIKGLEYDSLLLKIDPTKKMSDDDFNKFLVSYENLIQASLNYHNDIKKGDLNATMSYAKVSGTLAQVMTKLALASPNLTKEQSQKIEDLNQKYKKQFEEIEK